MGRGLQPKGVRVKEVADFKVYTKGAGTGELKVVVKGPSESCEEALGFEGCLELERGHGECWATQLGRGIDEVGEGHGGESVGGSFIDSIIREGTQQLILVIYCDT